MQESTSTCASQYVSTYACRVGFYIGTVWAYVGFKKYLSKILRCSSVCHTSTRVHWQGMTHLTSIRDSGSLIILSLRIRRHAYDTGVWPSALHEVDIDLSNLFANSDCRGLESTAAACSSSTVIWDICSAMVVFELPFCFNLLVIIPLLYESCRPYIWLS